ncbi:hypothetical protein D3C86_1817000 [compost metagenome]
MLVPLNDFNYLVGIVYEFHSHCIGFLNERKHWMSVIDGPNPTDNGIIVKQAYHCLEIFGDLTRLKLKHRAFLCEHHDMMYVVAATILELIFLILEAPTIIELWKLNDHPMRTSIITRMPV